MIKPMLRCAHSGSSDQGLNRTSIRSTPAGGGGLYQEQAHRLEAVRDYYDDRGYRAHDGAPGAAAPAGSHWAGALILSSSTR